MRREELEHLLRSATTMSIEADLAFLDDDDQAIADRVDGFIGEDSQFHRTHGYYGQGVAVSVAVLPDGWSERLVIVEGSNTQPGRGLCLEPHDLVIAKLIAYREKDFEFAIALIGARLVDVTLLLERLAQTSTAAPIQAERVRVWLQRNAC